ncbi:hypothetical protein PMKS-003947 [Pichia membranifaciens]|uniref:Zinc finger PHD-type domain-containing protein n=1 Tax=Pichia membranifaciens TaxID=4926 RepID=A0A1Q2YLL3_9ASCO|nr:hypothetical protein PMKS-003947 [Pichia membranifaciens]
MLTGRRSRSKSKSDSGKEEGSSDAETRGGFVEPALAESNIVTGQKMEDPPSVKVKKELGAFKRGTKHVAETPAVIEHMVHYRNSLKSSKELENSTYLSEIRTSLKREHEETDEPYDSKKIRKNSTKVEKKPGRNGDVNTTKTKSFLSVPKDVKVGKENGSDADSEIAPPVQPDSPALNNDYCSCCGMTGMFLCCESYRLCDYNDESFKPTKTYKQLVKEFDDPLHGIYDKNNNPLFCYYCGESGVKKELINCDYCPLSWHLDCLDPPITSVKKLGSKWKCPNHVDDLEKPIRKFKDQQIVPISNIKNFENSGKLPVNSNIEIVNIEDKLQALKDQIKSLHNNHNSSLKFSNLTFQINEEDIILNFINANKIRKLSENDENFQTLMNLQPNLKDYVLSLSQLSKKSLFDNEFKLLNLQNLLKISDEELKVEKKDFTNEEIKEFLIIKRLIRQKGKEKLMKFLNFSS